MTQRWTYPGARWWKFDFHTHTPASKDTRGWQAALGTPDELTPEAWLLRYMDAEIDCVAITDHNSGEWIDKLKAAYAQMKQSADKGFRELHLFPGVEISVQGGFHLLAIFDPSKSSQAINNLLAVVRYDGTRGDSDGVTREGAAKVLEEVRGACAIAIPAHADGAKGLLELVPGTRKTKHDTNTVKQVLGVDGLLALEWVDPENPSPIIFDELKLKLARVVGSDCHSFQGKAVPGSRFTWIKMATPSLEGLRLALLDGQGVSVKRSDDGDGFSPFDLPELFLESIEIADARFMGRSPNSAKLPLNPYLNALIGGRGTGKSTVVHSLRLAFKREREVGTVGEASETFTRFNQVARKGSDHGGLLASTRVAVELNRDGVRHRLTWAQDGRGAGVEDWDVSIQQWTPSSSMSINEQRFPIKIFSQGQIAALANDSQQALLQVIDDAAGSATAQKALAAAQQTFMATRARLRELAGKLSGRDVLNLGLQDVQRKLARFEVAHHADVLKAYQRSSRQARELDRQFDAVSEAALQLRTAAEGLLVEDLPEGLFEPSNDAEALLIVKQLAQSVAAAKAQLALAAQSLESQGAALRAQLAQGDWQGRAELSRIAYEALKADLATQGVSDPSEYGRLVQERQRLETEAKRLDALQTQVDGMKVLAEAQRGAVWQARRNISKSRGDFLQKTLADNRFVRMSLVRYGRDAQALEHSLRELLGAPEQFKDDIYAEAPVDAPAKGLIADFLSSAELFDGTDQPAVESAIQRLQTRLISACRGTGDFGARFNKYLVAEAEKRPELIDRILCWLPDDGLRVEYSRTGDGQNFNSISQASAGQRAAAMLAFLLAHGSEPLVLDQPEDDLDNHLIYDLVVQQIRANKQRRQLIVVTHNPNIVVNGDAELIHALDFNHQCYVKTSASLQDQAMRKEVCKIMEGGKDAFERRYQRLGREV